jgi:C-terminal processing protease CtpA/Prc
MQNNFAFKKVEILPGNIGYVRWDAFYEFVNEAKPIVDAAFQFVSHTKALIIDMRYNGGGRPEMVLQIQSYFFSEKTPMNYTIDRSNDTLKRWTDPAMTDIRLNMPVYILTSRGTFSGAEDFTYGMKYAKRAVIVGDTTGGGAHPTRPFSIGQGFVAFIPTHRSVNLITQTDWDGTGVWPDVVVPSDEALNKAQSLIFTEFLSETTDEAQRNMLQWNLTSLENRALLTKQIQRESIKLSKEELLKYCGSYISPDPDNPLPALFIILKENHIFRHLDNGAEDILLIPVSASKFVYDDESGRSIEFGFNEKDDNMEMSLATQGGVFKRTRKK